MKPHVLVVLENQPYPFDPRLRAQVDALMSAGYTVTVAGPTGFDSQELAETVEGVRVVRYVAPPGGRGLLGYVREYGVSMLRLGRLVRRVQREAPVHVVLVCNPPDLLILLALPLARQGAGIVFDNRELSPELFEAKFGRRGFVYRVLLWAEAFAFRRADAVILPSPSYTPERLRERQGTRMAPLFVVGNGPDPARIFSVPPRPELRRGREHLVAWVGGMSSQDGLHHLIDVADELVNKRGRRDVAFAIVGPGDVGEDLKAEIARRRLEGSVELPGRVEDDLVRAYMATADVCVGVDERNSMNDRLAMRKVLEYMAMGRPVVQFPLAEMRRLCRDATVYARNGDASDMADRIDELLNDPVGRDRIGAAARRRLEDSHLMWPDQVPSLLAAFRAAQEGVPGQRDPSLRRPASDLR